MNILIIGASSSIGFSLSKAFAENNNLFLLTSNINKLELLKKETIVLGALSTKIIEVDLQKELFSVDILPEKIDVIINVACATSKLKNFNISANKHKNYTEVDLTKPLFILEYYLKKIVKEGKNSKLNYIFINTILTKIQSRNYSIYYSYKLLQQEYIKAFKRKYNDTLKITNVIIGRNVNRNEESKSTISLAKRILRAINKNESEFIYGFEGKLIYALYLISPLLSNSIIFFKRLFYR
jgi:short-subunit dehydrogenase